MLLNPTACNGDLNAGTEYRPQRILPKKMILIPADLAEHPFYIDQTPVTYSDYRVYLEAGAPEPHYYKYSSYNKPNQPVTGITYNRAALFCNWRSRMQGLEPVYSPGSQVSEWGYISMQADYSTGGYRLPTETEFETAARGGSGNFDYPWGDKFSAEWANYDTDRGRSQSKKWWRLADVREMKANARGIYNMSGNIWHFTDTDLKGDHQSTVIKILKGGSWGSISPEELKIDNRSVAATDLYNYDIGFRCILPVSEKALQNTRQRPVKALSINFYRGSFTEIKTTTAFYDSKAFREKMARYIKQRFIENLNFKIKIDQQKIITPRELADLLIDTGIEYRINPVFLLGIMKSESGVSTVSFPRWFNNPMAYKWGNFHMKNGQPVYGYKKGRNRKYRTLKDGFSAYARGMRRKIYLNVSKKDLYSFHMTYVGYKAVEWMTALSIVYRDLLGVKLGPHYPKQNIRPYIYLK